MTYEITIEAGGSYNTSTKHFASMTEAISLAKAFAADWYRGARYAIYCIETEQFAEGAAN
jgi:hypothetical protein